MYLHISLNFHPPSLFRTTDHLGSGQFGTVNLGVWQCQQTAVEVAVKMLQPGAPEEDAVRFLQEAAIMGQFRHPNIVQLLGVVTVGKPVSWVGHTTTRNKWPIPVSSSIYELCETTHKQEGQYACRTKCVESTPQSL